MYLGYIKALFYLCDKRDSNPHLWSRSQFKLSIRDDFFDEIYIRTRVFLIT